MTNKKNFIKNGIANLLKTNYNISPDLIDLHSEIDSTLSFSENLTHIQDSFVAPRLSEVLI